MLAGRFSKNMALVIGMVTAMNKTMTMIIMLMNMDMAVTMMVMDMVMVMTWDKVNKYL